MLHIERDMHSPAPYVDPTELHLDLSLERALDLGDFIRASFLHQRSQGGYGGHALVTGVVGVAPSVDEGNADGRPVTCAKVDPEYEIFRAHFSVARISRPGGSQPHHSA